MSVFDSDIATAQELIAEFGRDVWFEGQVGLDTTVPGYPSEDPLAPDPTLYKTKMAFFAPKDLDRGVMQFFDQMPRTEVPDNTQIGLLAGGQSFEPNVAQTIWFEQSKQTSTSISKIDILAPDGTPVLYFITVAR